MSFVRAIAASWTGRIGLVCTAVGAVLLACSSIFGMPARSSLSRIEGVVSQATQVTHTATRRGEGRRITGVDFVLTIPRQGGEPVKLSIPSDEITREQVERLVGTQVTAEYDGERDVYALSSRGKDVITYDDSWNKRASALQVWAQRGKHFLALGVPLLLIGWPLGRRKLRKQAAAAT